MDRQISSRLTRRVRRRLVVLGSIALAGMALAACGSSSPKISTSTSVSAPVITEHFTRLSCNHNNTLGLEGCAEGQLLTTDHRINEEIALLFSLVPSAQQKSLAAAEATFLPYRKSTCTAYSDVYRGGSFAPVEYALCEVKVDEAHSTTLYGYFRLAEEGASHLLTWP
jgi:uncharacterized protein YecT (DUF1311 family)